ncbi:MAG: mannose-6-phosphate isomerase, class I [Spirochaetaceae bacterium]|jgi:mannose-6-phosphate isomerase|nr:mannose-6-phosphate isomerase, class I [Spirochaetaceae bacterium]
MKYIFKLKNQVKHYEWGSPSLIQELLNVPGDDSPWAELWMGVHPQGASETECGTLSALIAGDPHRFLGNYPALPFLFKVLAASRPLSIQAHPNRQQAQEGFRRENEAGIARNAPNRNYKDSNHKPEILCALTPFKALCGFRTQEEIQERLTLLFKDPTGLLKTTSAVLQESLAADVKTFLNTLLTLSQDNRHSLTELFQAQNQSFSEQFPEWRLCAAFAQQYPDDPALIAPLYLNVIDLTPGQAIYLPAGILHAYISGLGVELMANSDNVLRGGLTSKYVDRAELFHILDFSPFSPAILRPEQDVYPTPSEEFSLSVYNSRSLVSTLPVPRIVLNTKGIASLSISGETCTLRRGESAFIPAYTAGSGLTISGDDYTIYQASAGGKGAKLFTE